VPTVLTMKAVIIPTNDPSHHPIALPIVVPSKIMSFRILKRRHAQCRRFYFVSGFISGAAAATVDARLSPIDATGHE
jgi:hypothetical protein